MASRETTLVIVEPTEDPAVPHKSVEVKAAFLAWFKPPEPALISRKCMIESKFNLTSGNPAKRH